MDYRGIKGNGSDEMGRIDEQCKDYCGGSCDNGADICMIVCGVGKKTAPHFFKC